MSASKAGASARQPEGTRAYAQKGEVWFARMDEIAARVAKCIKDSTCVPRVDALPFYDKPVSVNEP